MTLLAQQANTELRAEVAALKADKARLDWLETFGAECCATLSSHSPQGLIKHWYWSLFGQGKGVVSANGEYLKTARAAIDAAMKP